MEKFKFSVETKHTVWVESFVDVEANSLEEAIKKVQELGADGMEMQMEFDYSEIIYDSMEEMFIGDNGGQPTAEIRVLETDKIIWNNVEGAK